MEHAKKAITEGEAELAKLMSEEKTLKGLVQKLKGIASYRTASEKKNRIDLQPYSISIMADQFYITYYAINL